MHLKCIIAISNNLYLAHKFCAISFNRPQDLHFPKNSRKIVTTAPLAKYARKFYINIILENKYIACKILYDSMQ